MPWYLSKFYWWAYLHPNAVRFFDRPWMINLILLGNYRRLGNAALYALGGVVDERVLQVACVYGDLTPRLIEKLEGRASLDVVDVAQIQLDNIQRKLPAEAPVCLKRVTLNFRISVSCPREMVFPTSGRFSRTVGTLE